MKRTFALAALLAALGVLFKLSFKTAGPSESASPASPVRPGDGRRLRTGSEDRSPGQVPDWLASGPRAWSSGWLSGSGETPRRSSGPTA